MFFDRELSALSAALFLFSRFAIAASPSAIFSRQNGPLIGSLHVTMAFVLGIVLGSRDAPGTVEYSPRQLSQKAIEAIQWTHNAHSREEFVHKRVVFANDYLEVGAPLHETRGWAETFIRGDYLRTIFENAPLGSADAAHLETLITPKFRIFWRRDRIVQYTEDKAIVEKFRVFDRVVPVYVGWFLNGTTDQKISGVDPFDFSEALKLGNVSPIAPEDQIEGVPCRVVSVQGPSWQFRAWIAPSRGCNFLKYTLDVHTDKALNLQEFHFLVDHVKCQELSDGKWVIQSGRRLQHGPMKEGKAVGGEFDVTRTLIETSPDFDKLKAFDLPPIPNGESAEIQRADANGNEVEDSGLKNIWKDGAIVPAYDPKLIERIKRLEEPAATSTSP